VGRGFSDAPMGLSASHQQHLTGRAAKSRRCVREVHWHMRVVGREPYVGLTARHSARSLLKADWFWGESAVSQVGFSSPVEVPAGIKKGAR